MWVPWKVNDHASYEMWTFELYIPVLHGQLVCVNYAEGVSEA